MGILIVKAKPGAAVRPAASDVRDLARWVIDHTAVGQAKLYRLAEQIRAGTAPFAEPERPIDSALVDLLRCPDCRGALEPRGAGLRCTSCGTDFRGEYGVPVLYPVRFAESATADAEALRRLAGNDIVRARTLGRVKRRLRRNERTPGPLRRLFWRVDGMVNGGLHVG
jgi:uncharacterized protein YbaR (Trm112 family)